MKVAILAGGSGTRLWPLSREDYPKQFIRINSEFSFFQNTLLRVMEKFSLQEILISSQRNYRFHTISDLLKLIPGSKELPHLVFEPESKNTFGALLAILNYCLQKLSLPLDEVLALLPSDHLVEPAEKFNFYLELAQKYASGGNIIVFGIVPEKESTGYGYIRTEGRRGETLKVIEFIEKPEREIIKKLLRGGNCFWNSGIFCFQIKTMLDEIERLYPNLIPLLQLEPDRFQQAFAQLPNISIDNAIMEKTQRALLIPMPDIYWNDIGCFDALYEILEKDSEQNICLGNVITKEVSGSFLLSNKRLVSAIGVKDLLIIETEDALLVVPKSMAQKVKELVEELKKKQSKEVFEHLTHYRPWGNFTVLEEGPRYKIKHVVVSPGESLSLQLHHHRSEHWVVINGMAKVRIGEEEKFIYENESAYVPRSTLHRLENPGKMELELIEVQNGEYLGEDDIQRFEDKYSRIR